MWAGGTTLVTFVCTRQGRVVTRKQQRLQSSNLATKFPADDNHMTGTKSSHLLKTPPSTSVVVTFRFTSHSGKQVLPCPHFTDEGAEMESPT